MQRNCQKQWIIPENGDNYYQNISLARLQSSHENIYVVDVVNVDVLKKIFDKLLYTATSYSP